MYSPVQVLSQRHHDTRSHTRWHSPMHACAQRLVMSCHGCPPCSLIPPTLRTTATGPTTGALLPLRLHHCRFSNASAPDGTTTYTLNSYTIRPLAPRFTRALPSHFIPIHFSL